MVAYSFQKRFAPLIIAGTKCQTIRGHRKRHARIGEPVQLFTGMRTKHCKKIIDDPVCVSVENINLLVDPKDQTLSLVHDSGIAMIINQGFAQADGFETTKEMFDFWLDAHGPGLFRGVRIKWETEI